ncbi:hypothetical protein SNE40_018126 [Patella caerulea]|uniref:Uncharacterized protein n=1 Tax=Patella caerulea TaxID=87958 RepID=A0AAN8J9V7_PATCE
MEELRREEDRRRLQAERDRREAERFRLLSMRQTKQDYAPSPDVRVIRPTSPNLHNLDLYRQQLREERRKLEDLLNRKIEVKKDIDLRVIKQKKQQ